MGEDARFAYFRSVDRLYGINRLPLLNGVCVDLGAHIGAFSIRIVERTNCTIHAYEPDPDNYKTMLDLSKKHGVGGKIVGFREALSKNSGTTDLYLSSGEYKDAHTLFGKSGKTIPVATVTPETIFGRIDGTIPYCKSNCQGGEYWLLKYFNDNNACLDRIERLCVEIHLDLFDKHEIAETLRLLRLVISKKPIGLKVAFAQHKPGLISQAVKDELMVDTL